jgi:hypothetical protein
MMRERSLSSILTINYNGIHGHSYFVLNCAHDINNRVLIT